MRMPGAVWIGPTGNRYPGGMSTVVGVVLHIQQGTEAGTEAWQRNPRSQVSSHFLLPKTGGIRQMVDTDDAAWCEVAGNRHWLSIECEGLSGQTLTAAQLEGAARILLWAHQQYGVRLYNSNDWQATTAARGGLGYHAMGGAAWGGHFDCPGSPIVNQRTLIVERAKALQRGSTVDVNQQIGDIHYTTTQIPDPADPQGPRIPLHVAASKQLALIGEMGAELDAIKQDLATIIAKLG